MTNFKEIQISEIFDIERGKSKYTQTFIENNFGNYNIYSAKTSKEGLMGKINIYDHDTESLTYTTNGAKAGTLFYREKHKFSLNGDSAIMILKDSGNLDYKYIYYNLYFKFKEYGFSWGNKATPSKVAEIFIKLPINKNGEFDLEKQKEIASKYEKLEKLKDRIRIMKEDLENQNISLEDIYIGEEKELNKLFDVRQGDAFYTKKRILENNWIGDIPVYSSNTKEEGLLVGINKEFIKEKDLYYQNCLTWSIDGYAGKIFARNTENINNDKIDKYCFTINNHCGILLPKLDNLYLPFIKIILQHKFFAKAKGYGNNKLGNNQIEDIFLKIPTKENGEFDLEKQKEIASKYEKIEKIQKTLIEELEYLEKVKVEI